MEDDSKLTLKDKRILKELDLDARQSNSKIAKKTRLSKNIVNYRIKR
ncbi:winged helix-turn-helix transcriptional regulator, partial [Candidatus Woesearchaeota archaeon]|nr:winged helix-turn-helix transcriptional regulator [Candidatus Woesearchaeota archaeon]